MKRLICALLCLILALTPLSASAATGDLYLEVENAAWVQHIAQVGDCVCLLTRDALSVWTPGSDVTTCRLDSELPEGAEYCSWTALFDLDGTPMALREVNNQERLMCVQLCALRPRGEGCAAGVIAEYDWEDLTYDIDGWRYGRYIAQAVYQDGALFLVAEDDSRPRTLCRVDLADGSAEFSQAISEDICGLCHAGAGKLLAAVCTEEGSRLYLYDIAADEAADLGLLCEDAWVEATNLTYDPAADELFYIRDGSVYCKNLTSGEERECAGTGGAGSSGGSACLLSGKYYVSQLDSGAVCVRNVRPQAGEESTGTLRILCMADEYTVEQAARRFQQDHSQLDLAIRDAYDMDEEQLLSGMLNRSSDWDVLAIPTDSSAYERLRDRGFLYPLGGEYFSAQADRLYPALREALSHGGELVAWPYEIDSCETLGYNPRALEKLGLTPADLPDSWAELMGWLADELPGLLTDEVSAFLLEEPWRYVKRELFEQALGLFAQSGRTDYTDEALVKLLRDLNRCTAEALHIPAEEYPDMPLGEDNGLLDTMWPVSMSGGHGEYEGIAEDSIESLLLPLFGEEEPLVCLPAYVLVVNPYSEHGEEAVAFVQCAAENLSSMSQYMIFPDLNEPLPNPMYEEWVKKADEQVERLTAMGDKVSPEELEYAKEYARRVRVTEQYLITRGGIDWYRAFGENVRFLRFDPAATVYMSEELRRLKQQVLKEGADPLTFLSALEGKVAMSRREDE